MRLNQILFSSINRPFRFPLKPPIGAHPSPGSSDSSAGDQMALLEMKNLGKRVDKNPILQVRLDTEPETKPQKPVRAFPQSGVQTKSEHEI